MRERIKTIGWGPQEDAPHFVASAFRTYGKDAHPATLIITMHAAESVSDAGFRSAIYIQADPKRLRSSVNWFQRVLQPAPTHGVPGNAIGFI
jgi:hypothetical protein